MKKTNLPIDGQRLWDDVMALADITELDQPYTRRSFTARFLEGRAYLAQRFKEAGLEVRIDTGGNLIGRRAGARPELGAIVLGSHSDTVPDGGRFDGVAGVIAALEVARSLAEAGHALDHDLEVIDFLAEEVSAFGLSCVGSRAVAGRLEPAMLDYAGPGGERLGEAILRIGGDPTRLAEARRENIAAFLELHIEQGRVLEAEQIDIGIVRTIVGITRIELVVEGRADHAGATPMALRSDALSGAVEVVRAIRDKAREFSECEQGYFVATTGQIAMEPNAANVVPRLVRLVVDARSERREVMERFLAWIKAETPPLAAAQRASLSRVSILSDAPPAAGDLTLCETLAEASDALGLTHRQMASGAGHDAAFISRIAPAAMIFTPCRDGRSHCPEEWVDADQLAAGASAMFEATLLLDRRVRGDVPSLAEKG